MIKSFSASLKERIQKFMAQFSVMALIILGTTACSSYENFKNITEDIEIPTQVYRADYNKVWIEVMKITNKYAREVTNQDAGIIKTRWIDNTLELNFADSFGSNDSVKTARFKLIINVVKGYRGNREVSKVTVFKRQQVQQDYLDGWKVVKTDGIVEKSILYRIERSLVIEAKLQEIEDKKTKEAEKNF